MADSPFMPPWPRGCAESVYALGMRLYSSNRPHIGAGRSLGPGEVAPEKALQFSAGSLFQPDPPYAVEDDPPQFAFMTQ